MQFTDKEVYLPHEVINEHLMSAIVNLNDVKTMKSAICVFRDSINVDDIDKIKVQFLVNDSTTKKKVNEFGEELTHTYKFTRCPNGVKHGKCSVIKTDWLGDDDEHHEVMYVDGLKHGKYTGYYKGGTLRSTGQYKNGKKDGEWIHYYFNIENEDENGEPIPNPELIIYSKAYYVNGLREGNYVTYYEDELNGVVHETMSYIKGKLNGNYITYDTLGRINSIAQYLNDQRNGVSKTYDSGHKIYNECNYKNDQKHSEEINYLGGLKFSKLCYMNDVRHGLAEYYFNDGTIKSRYNFVNSKREGTLYEYYKCSAIINRTTHYIRGFKCGLSYEYSIDGDLISTTMYRKDIIDGLCTKFYPSAKMMIKSITLYSNEKPMIHMEYDEGGNMIKSHVKID